MTTCMGNGCSHCWLCLKWSCFVLSFSPRDFLGEIWNWIESVHQNFPIYSYFSASFSSGIIPFCDAYGRDEAFQTSALDGSTKRYKSTLSVYETNKAFCPISVYDKKIKLKSWLYSYSTFDIEIPVKAKTKTLQRHWNTCQSKDRGTLLKQFCYGVNF